MSEQEYNDEVREYDRLIAWEETRALVWVGRAREQARQAAVNYRAKRAAFVAFWAAVDTHVTPPALVPVG